MPHFRLTKKAIEDFKEIGRYTQREWGRAQRNLYLSKLDACFHMIAHEPGIGKPCDDIRPGYRKYHHGRHLVFYKQGISGSVDIVRILHDQMDVESHLQDDLCF